MYDDIYPRQLEKEQYKSHSFENRILFEVDFERFIHRNLDIRELVVSRMLLGGYTITEIAKHQGVSRRYIGRVVFGLRSKLRRFLEDFLF